jgi:hypothetical protein
MAASVGRDVSSLIVLVIDRLGAAMLGPYGNTWIDTPNFNHLASASLLCENAIADSPDLRQAYRGYLTGEHALGSADGRSHWLRLRNLLEASDDALLSMEPPANSVGSMANWVDEATRAGKRTVLLTDDEEVARFEVCQAFGEHVLVPQGAEEGSAKDVAETGIARLFEAAAELLPTLQAPFVLVVHSRGMEGLWDAPLELRNRFADEDDPTPPPIVVPPNERIGRDFDPDLVLGYRHAYAGQVTLLDMCLGMLLDEIERQKWSGEVATILTSPRGFPLGQHGRIGPCDAALYSELVHVPLMVRLPRRGSFAQRRQALVQSSDLAATCAGLLGMDGLWASSRSLVRLLSEGDASGWQVATALAAGQRLIRTPAWLLRETIRDGEGLTHELFAKPDDYWEVNEIANRASDIVQLLAGELSREHARKLGLETTQAAPLSEPLVSLWR